MPVIECFTLNQLLARASNIVGGNKTKYTVAMFLADFPQFSKIETEGETTKTVSLVPESMLNQFIVMANNAIQEERWFDKWQYATGLYIAHYATLYLKSYAPASSDNDATTASASGTTTGNVASASEGDQSISYDNSAITSGTEKWGTWNATTYGQQLVIEAGLLGKGGSYII